MWNDDDAGCDGREELGTMAGLAGTALALVLVGAGLASVTYYSMQWAWGGNKH